MVEKWVNIENHPSYFISNFGRVFSKKSNESSYSTEQDGHLSVNVCDCANGKRKTHHGYKWIWECDYLDMIGGALS